jgi:nucleotide-binding universal stress UspA family protein
MFEKILVANDGSAGGMKALDVAIELAAMCNAHIESLSVEEALPHYAATIGEVEETKRQKDAFFEDLRARSQERAEARGVKLRFHVVPGHEVETIVRHCKEGEFDLLVIGFLGHSSVWGRIWGSTSQNLARLAPCSVLIVK